MPGHMGLQASYSSELQKERLLHFTLPPRPPETTPQAANRLLPSPPASCFQLDSQHLSPQEASLRGRRVMAWLVCPCTFHPHPDSQTHTHGSLRDVRSLGAVRVLPHLSQVLTSSWLPSHDCGLYPSPWKCCPSQPSFLHELL